MFRRAASSADDNARLRPCGPPLAAALGLALALLAGGCATPVEQGGPAAPVAGEERPAPPVQLEAPAADEDQAAGYLRLAGQAEGERRASYELKAAESLLQSGRAEDARQVLEGAAPAEPANQARRQLLLARLALEQQRPADAVAALGTVEAQALEPALAREVLALQATAWAAAGRRDEELRVRTSLEPLLDTPEDRRLNHQGAWAAAGSLTPEQASALAADSDAAVAGWAALGLLVASDGEDPAALSQALADWQQRFPGHPATGEVVPALQAATQALFTPPSRVALLLPTEGRFARAAAAIRAGFLAAWYADTRPERPALAFYDAGPQSAPSAYAQAIAEGAQVVVGPLEKEAVTAVASQGANGAGVPTLLLNTLQEEDAPSGNDAALAGLNRFQFGLSPEDEAVHAAERAWFDGHARALLLRSEDDWGARVSAAFRARWEQLGGELVEERSFLPGTREFDTFVKEVLDVRGPPQSREESAEGAPPRWRQDIDVIFMAAYPVEARQIAPQLRFLDVRGLPLYATSHAYPGDADPEVQSDLEGVILGDMPWVVEPAARREDLYQLIAGTYPQEPASFQRLYAFGIDAYSVLPQLGSLRLQSGARYAGQTGVLRMDPGGRILRQLSWARFEQGGLRLLDGTAEPQSPDAPVDPLGLR